MTSLQPRTKAELVSAVAVRTNLTEAQLKDHRTDRLREVWSLVRPCKRALILPSCWQKFDRSTLIELYPAHPMVDWERPADNHWSKWTRAKLVTELEIWLTEIKELGLDEVEDLYSSAPLCSQCKIPMTARTNRIDKSEFFGCIRFPNCRETLPIEYDKKPVQAVLKTMGIRQAKGAGYSASKNPVMTSPERKKSATRRAPGSASDGSWRQVGTMRVDSSEDEGKSLNANLSPDETQLIMEMRAKKASNKGSESSDQRKKD